MKRFIKEHKSLSLLFGFVSASAAAYPLIFGDDHKPDSFSTPVSGDVQSFGETNTSGNHNMITINNTFRNTKVLSERPSIPISSYQHDQTREDDINTLSTNASRSDEKPRNTTRSFDTIATECALKYDVEINESEREGIKQISGEVSLDLKDFVLIFPDTDRGAIALAWMECIVPKLSKKIS